MTDSAMMNAQLGREGSSTLLFDMIIALNLASNPGYSHFVFLFYKMGGNDAFETHALPDLLGFVDSDDLPCVVNDCQPFRNIQESNSGGFDHCGCCW